MKIDLPKEWLKAAFDDLKVISNIIDKPDLSHMIAFHSHQAIEKTFKAIIEYKQLRIPKQHDLLKLKELIQDEFFIENDDLLDTLNQLYIDARYPGDMGLLPYGKPSLKEAHKFYQFGLTTYHEACKILQLEESKNAKKF